VSLGIAEAPLADGYFTDPAMTQAVLFNTPVGRWGQLADIVGPVLFLCYGRLHERGRDPS
jgi:hypothetical protein